PAHQHPGWPSRAVAQPSPAGRARHAGTARVRLFARRSVAEALHGNGGEVAPAHRGVEREQHLVPGGEIALGTSGVDAAALDEAVMAHVVSGAVASRYVRRQRRVLRHEYVEGDAAAVLVLAEHAEVPGEPLCQLVSRSFVEVDGETDGAGAERMRRAP